MAKCNYRKTYKTLGLPQTFEFHSVWKKYIPETITFDTAFECI